MKENKPRKSPMTEKEHRRKKWKDIESGKVKDDYTNAALSHFGFNPFD